MKKIDEEVEDKGCGKEDRKEAELIAKAQVG